MATMSIRFGSARVPRRRGASPPSSGARSRGGAARPPTAPEGALTDGLHTGPIVLVVDDDPDTRELLTELIRSRGYEPRCASSVPEALETLERLPIALVITDFAMPGESGLALLHRMQHRPEWVAPAVLISGHDLDGTLAQQARHAGAEFLAKPIDLARLVAIVTRALGPSDPRTE